MRRAILAPVRRASNACLVLAAALTLAGAQPATAQDDGVFVNPDSPSGVEYDLPLERARRQANPEQPAAPPSQTHAQPEPFGAGVGSPATAPTPGAAPSGDAQDDPPSRERGSRKRAGRRDAPLPPEIVAAAARPVPPRTDGSVLLYGGAGSLVVALSALLGLALRRRRGQA
jgi:hypothetical protein